jgi:glycine dehydrogenase subunit 2
MVAILGEASEDAQKLKAAPYTMPVRRLDDVRAAKQLELTWKPVDSAA